MADMNQAAINGIRVSLDSISYQASANDSSYQSTGAKQTIHVEGNAWTGAW